MSEKLNRRAILAGAAAVPALAVPAIAAPASLDKAATVARAQQIVDVLGGCYVRKGWNEAFDKERAAKFLEAVQGEDYTDNDPAGAVVSAWMHDHNQSFDWLYSGNPLSMICGAAARSPAASFAMASTATHPDAALLELGRRLTVAWATERAVEAKSEGSQDSPNVSRELEASFQAAFAIVREIRASTATTIDGLRVKAAAIAWCQGGEETIFDEAATTDLQIAESIVRDLLTMQGVQS